MCGDRCVWGRMCCLGWGGRGGNQEMRCSQIWLTEILTPKHKQDWASPKNKYPATLKYPLRFKGSNTAWEISRATSHGFDMQSLNTLNIPWHVNFGKYFHLDFVPQTLHQWGFHIYLQYSPLAVFCFFTLQTLVIMSALSMQWRNLKHVNTTGRCTDCISAVFTSMITLYCAR